MEGYKRRLTYRTIVISKRSGKLNTNEQNLCQKGNKRETGDQKICGNGWKAAYGGKLCKLATNDNKESCRAAGRGKIYRAATSGDKEGCRTALGGKICKTAGDRKINSTANDCNRQQEAGTSKGAGGKGREKKTYSSDTMWKPKTGK